MNPALPFTPRLPPISHQGEYLAQHGLDPAWGLFWEQGTGKTKAMIDDAVLLLMNGLISGTFVLAPNGVHRNWHVEELPKHWPVDAPPYLSFAWDTNKAANKGHARDFDDFLQATHPADPANPNAVHGILCMSYDSMITDAGKAASWAFMRRRKTLYIADESQRFKSPTTRGKNKVERTAVVTKSGVYADYRRIASGTPMDTPLDVYSQVRFLDPDFWVREMGIGSFAAFKAHFAVVQTAYAPGGREFPQVVGYKNLDELERVLKRISTRVLKADVLDLPPKVYKRVYHPLSPAQRTAYDELRGEAMTWLASGELVTAEMALTLQLRCAQISAGFVGPGPGLPPVPFKENPRAAVFREVLRDLTRPAIIWGRFTHDIAVAQAASLAAGRRPVVYDGNRPGDSLDAFHAGRADDIIGNLSSGLTEGHTLVEADSTLYYTRSAKLIENLQSEDRNHRIGQGHTVTVFDFLGERTRDRGTLDRLQQKRTMSGQVLGDDAEGVRAWLREMVEEDAV